MRAELLPYWRVLVAGLRRQSTYRLAAFGGLAANVTFGLLKAAMLFATVRAAGGELNGYDLGTMGAYVWLSQALLGSVNLHGGSAFAERIRTGDVAIDFLRPLNPQAASVLTEVGGSIFALLQRGLPTLTIGALTVGMSMPTTPWPYLLGAVSLLLGIVLSWAAAYLVAGSGFWLIETRGLRTLYMVLTGFFAGLFVPIALFPDWLRVIAHCTPFPAMLQYPVDVVSGRVDLATSATLLIQQLGWLAAVVLAGHLLTVAGRTRLEVQGG